MLLLLLDLRPQQSASLLEMSNGSRLLLLRFIFLEVLGLIDRLNCVQQLRWFDQTLRNKKENAHLLL